MALTVSTHYAIPSLIGRGLTEALARDTLVKARIYGQHNAVAGTRVIPVSYAFGKYTIGQPR